MASEFQHIFLYGQPGVGKTTLISRIYDHLSNNRSNFAVGQLSLLENVRMSGFYTSESRPAGGQRTGFKVISLPDKSECLLAVDENSFSSTFCKKALPKIGKYSVLVDDFEKLALKTLILEPSTNRINLFIIDEIGKMECLSKEFCSKIRQIADEKNAVILGTLPIDKPNLPPLINWMRKRPAVKMFEITRENRNRIQNEIEKCLLAILACCQHC